MDEFGPLNLQPHPDNQWAARSGRSKGPDTEPRPRRRATWTRPHGAGDNYSPHLTTKKCQRVETWSEANNVANAYTRPTPSS